MNSIVTNLLDPSWWFTAVVVAILASIIAAFGKDYIERRFNIFIAWSADRREDKANRREAVIAAWSKTEALLIILLLRMLYSVLLCLTSGTLTSLYVTYVRLKFPSTDQVTGLSAAPVRYLVSVAVLTLLSSVLAYSTVTNISLTEACFRRFRDARNLPKLTDDDDI